MKHCPGEFRRGVQHDGKRPHEVNCYNHVCTVAVFLLFSQTFDSTIGVLQMILRKTWSADAQCPLAKVDYKTRMVPRVSTVEPNTRITTVIAPN